MNKYFDLAASCPMSQKAVEAYSEAARTCCGNTESLHRHGQKAAQLLAYSRDIFAEHLTIRPERIIFTSGGTESNRLAIETLLHNAKTGCNHVIISGMDHPSIEHTLRSLAQKGGISVDILKHLPDGSVDLLDLERKIRPETALAVIQHVNSEIGVIQDIEAIAAILEKYGVALHVDCVQSFGKMDLAPLTSLTDSLTVSAHKIGGPKGSGACIFTGKIPPLPLTEGISHEFGYRAGTIDVPSIFALTVALQESAAVMDFRPITTLRSSLITMLRDAELYFEVVEGARGRQLPHILSLLFKSVQGQYVMMELDRKGYSVSTGSACQVGMHLPPKALLAIGIEPEKAKSSIRISLGPWHTIEDCRMLADAIIEIVKPAQM
ncbi:MAG: cysteine desulfurase family protein [Bacillus sp. (in: firmicutes)]